MSSTATETSFRNLRQGDLEKLAEVSGGPCVSILMPTHRRGRETREDPIRLKNLLTEASEKLKQRGDDEAILDVLAARVDDPEFWRHQGDGLAIYVTKEDCRLIRLNRQVDEAVDVGETFLISPLVREHNAQGQHFVLSLTWESTALYRCDGESLTVVETDRLPAKADALVLPRDPEESLQNTSHQTPGNTGAASVGMFHGQGEGEDKIEADRSQYLSIVGDEVSGAVYNTGMPLVVVATKEVSGHFQSNSDVKVDARVDGSPAAMSEEEMQSAAHEAVAPELEADRSRFHERFGKALADSQGSQDLDRIIEAAKNGRVDSLMICDVRCVQTNRAVGEVIRHGGDVFRCAPEAMTGDDTKAAAIFRY